MAFSFSLQNNSLNILRLLNCNQKTEIRISLISKSRKSRESYRLLVTALEVDRQLSRS